MVIYEHWNEFNEYDKNRSFPISNWSEKNKPLGGLWGSRVGATRSWKKFSEEEDEKLKEYMKEHNIESQEGFVPPVITKFDFTVKEGAYIFTVRNYNDYLNLPKSTDKEGREYVDYLKCLAQGIDAVELCSFGEEFEEFYDESTIDKFDDAFCSHWQCDSIVVLNPESYEIIA